MNSLLEVTDLRMVMPTTHGPTELLRGVSFTVARGEAVGIVGESGSGKTLTLRSLIGLTPRGSSVSGQVRVDGESVMDLSPRRLRGLRREQVGMIFQDPHAAINPVYRVGDFLTEPWRRSPRLERAAATERAAALLARVRITDPERVLASFPHQLSGGMLQRVMIAAAVMHDPGLLLADEPTTALDVTTQSEVLALMNEVRAEHGASLILITHDIGVVAAVCDRILVMYRGRVVEELTPAQLYAGEISEPYTEALLSCRPEVTRRQDRLPVVAAGAFDERYAD
ncbi:MAG: ABC transporter ATP-binding protein [Nocardioides sp.]|uniref:ABC transporter ATP-binding protein n=1 Tax=Nocardioides sp. TaxID=35761 RepID=UPI003267D58B